MYFAVFLWLGFSKALTFLLISVLQPALCVYQRYFACIVLAETTYNPIYSVAAIVLQGSMVMIQLSCVSIVPMTATHVQVTVLASLAILVTLEG